MINTVFFDMDGVLADFTGGSLKVHGKSLPPRGIEWNFFSQVGITEPEFWKPLRNRKFWADLEPLPDGMELFRRVVDLIGDKENVGILSNGACPTSCDGKRDWIRHHLPDFEENIVFAQSKGLCANSSDVLLIDDYEKNIGKFRARRGKAIIAPRSWNSRRDEIDDNGMFDPVEVFKQVVRMKMYGT